jgi:RNA polymerase sigma-70 factor (ECF subfamily)
LSIDVADWYRRFAPLVLRRCRRLLREEERAVDALQDVFVQLMSHGDRLDDRAPTALLLRMATNTCLNRIREQKVRGNDTEADLLNRIAASGIDNETHSLATLVLRRLFRHEPASTRLIAVLHLVDGLTLADVAAEVGLSVSGVRWRLRELRASLEAQGAPADALPKEAS